MQMIIASRLTDGRVVFMDEVGGWADGIAHGLVLDDDGEAARRMADAEQDVLENAIVDPYLIDVVIEDGRRRPSRVREAIRAFGPTVRTDLEDAPVRRVK